MATRDEALAGSQERMRVRKSSFAAKWKSGRKRMPSFLKSMRTMASWASDPATAPMAMDQYPTSSLRSQSESSMARVKKIGAIPDARKRRFVWRMEAESVARLMKKRKSVNEGRREEATSRPSPSKSESAAMIGRAKIATAVMMRAKMRMRKLAT